MQNSSKQNPVSAPRWLVWLRWVVANLLGGIVGYLFGGLLGPLLSGFPTLLLGIMGAIVGVAQWQTLRDFVPGLSGALWVSFTALGFGFAGPILQATGQVMAWAAGAIPEWQAMVGDTSGVQATLGLIHDWRYPAALLGAVLTGGVGGLALGAAQAWVLRRYVRDVWLWVAFHVAGGIVGTLFGLFGALLLLPLDEQFMARVFLILFLVPSGIFLIASFVTGGGVVALRDRVRVDDGSIKRV